MDSNETDINHLATTNIPSGYTIIIVFIIISYCSVDSRRTLITSFMESTAFKGKQQNTSIDIIDMNQAKSQRECILSKNENLTLRIFETKFSILVIR